MSTRPRNAASGATPHAPSATGSYWRRRPRIPILMSGAALVLTAANYSGSFSSTLTMFALVAALTAAAWPREIKSTTRRIVWGYVMLAVLGAAFNLDRFAPEGSTLFAAPETHAFDRSATLIFAAGITALFFSFSRMTVTLCTVAALPLLMIGQDRAGSEALPMRGVYTVSATVLLLLCLASQMQRATAPRQSGVLRTGAREWIARAAALAFWLVAAALLVRPLTRAAEGARNWVFERAGFTYRDRWRSDRAGPLGLAAPPWMRPEQTRIMMEIEADREPRYLRESVFRVYSLKQWVGRAGTSIKLAAPQSEIIDKYEWQRYRLVAGESPETDWRFRPLPGSRMASLSLPGGARTLLLPQGIRPVLNSDGVPNVMNQPPYYMVGMPATGGTDAFRGAGSDAPENYLGIPGQLAATITNWVVGAGLELGRASEPGAAGMARAKEEAPFVGEAPETRAARLAAAAVDYFNREFEYSLETNYGKKRGVDPLVEFMEARKGHCTLFASAAALMLRAQGVPTRVVAGFYCHERHRFTGDWVVRARDGHAWCEAWDEEAGEWFLVEATPAGGLPDDYAAPAAWRLRLERLQAAWRNMLEAIRRSDPLVAVANALADALEALWDFASSAVGIALLTLAGLASAIWLAARVRRGRPKRGSQEYYRLRLEHAMLRIEARMAPAAHRRLPHESWGRWLRRMQSCLPAAVMEELERRAEEYQTLRYSQPLDIDAARSWLAAIEKK